MFMINAPRFKFRICYTAQDGSKRMIYDDNRFLIGLNADVFENYGESFNKPMWEAPFDVAEPPVLQQFTGMADKNDKYVYEGDIIKCKRCHLNPMVEGPKGTFHSSPDYLVEDGEELGIVFSDVFGYKWTVEFRRYDDFEDLSHFCAPWRIEVVGNTFENSDLLKGFQNSTW